MQQSGNLAAVDKIGAHDLVAPPPGGRGDAQFSREAADPPQDAIRRMSEDEIPLLETHFKSAIRGERVRCSR